MINSTHTITSKERNGTQIEKERTCIVFNDHLLFQKPFKGKYIYLFLNPKTSIKYLKT